ncbi:NAD-dependent epimerase/dehydratase family protein [Akkermansiaceae bacterium]|nr:NAD-dependent epimerase/dehydratase family protein [Akkermansiaceae bacterium]
MIKIGITGQSGFVGLHLYNTVKLFPASYMLIDFQKSFFKSEKDLDSFVSQCDVIVHLAAINRHKVQSVIYNTNILLVKKLVASLKRTNSDAHVIMSSSIQEEKDTSYAKSKKNGREIFTNWENNSEGVFSGLIIPNVYGPFGKPFYNSVVSTFCYKITRGEEPEIQVDGALDLIYITELVQAILNVINKKESNQKLVIQETSQLKVSELLSLLKSYKNSYQDKGEIPEIKSAFELNLFNTFRCFMDTKNHFPVKYIEHKDPRGSFVEIIRLGLGGQVSFSTTEPGIVRGNHFHIRKLERFAVIKGKALIQLRRVGTDEVLEFYLDGNKPSYVDIPIWYTHNIKNIGEEILYTNFWINEPYNPETPDTYSLKV